MHVEGSGAGAGYQRPARLIDTACIKSIRLADTTVAILRLRPNGRIGVLVSTRLPRNQRPDAAIHALSHLEDARVYDDVAAWCSLETCPDAQRWLAIPSHKTAAGL